MSNGTKEIKSSIITDLYHQIVRHNPVNEHWTLSHGGFAAIITKAGKKSILIYNFARSIKPLARVVEGGAVTVIRDYFTEKEMIDHMADLSALTLLQVPLPLGDHAQHTHGTRESFASTSEPVNISEILDKVSSIAQECGIPVPPRHPKVCDPHRQ